VPPGTAVNLSKVLGQQATGPVASCYDRAGCRGQLPDALSVGAALVPEYVPWKPKLVDPPGGIVPL